MMSGNGVFVTGTDTGVGKTVVSAILVAALRKTRAVKYWKPIQTGIEEDDDTETVRMLGNCSEDEILREGIRLERPLSPHLSARLAGRPFSISDVLKYLPASVEKEFWVVEGAGGVLVPLNKTEFMIDFVKALDLAAVVVSRSGLGTINHTLMTIESLRGRGIDVAGVVMNGEPNYENLAAIEEYGKIGVLASVPVLRPLTRESVSAFCDGLAINL